MKTTNILLLTFLTLFLFAACKTTRNAEDPSWKWKERHSKQKNMNNNTKDEIKVGDTIIGKPGFRPREACVVTKVEEDYIYYTSDGEKFLCHKMFLNLINK